MVAGAYNNRLAVPCRVTLPALALGLLPETRCQCLTLEFPHPRHPDKATAKLGSALDPRDKDAVMAGVRAVAQQLTGLMAGG